MDAQLTMRTCWAVWSNLSARMRPARVALKTFVRFYNSQKQAQFVSESNSIRRWRADWLTTQARSLRLMSLILRAASAAAAVTTIWWECFSAETFRRVAFHWALSESLSS